MGHGSSLGQSSKSKASPLAHVKGYGASSHGSSTWLFEKLTAIGAVFPIFYIVISLIFGMGSDVNTIANWFASPFNLSIALFGIVMTYGHGAYAVCTVIDDYIHGDALCFFSKVIVKFVFLFFAIITVASMIKLAAFGG